MAKYTTEVRTICEFYAGLDESVGVGSVDDVISQARDKIFNFNYPIFDTTYKPVLESKILKHYYTNEIGFESVGLWKLFLNDKMNMIMPYFNQLYESEKIKFNPFTTTEMITLKNGENQNNSNGADTNIKNSNSIDSINKNSNSFENANETSDSNDHNESINNSIVQRNNKENGENINKYSDTPQGTVANLLNGTYLTNATQDTTNTSKNDHDLSQGVIKGNNTNNSTNNNYRVKQDSENDVHNNINNDVTQNYNTNQNNTVEYYIENIAGRNISGSELLLKWRDTFINIDELVVNELSDLFMHLW